MRRDDELDALRAIQAITQNPRNYGYVSGPRTPDPEIMRRLRDDGMWETAKLGERPDFDSPVIHGNFASRMEDIRGPRLTAKGRERLRELEGN